MRIYLDDDLDSNRLIGLLKNDGHTVVSPREVGTRGATDLNHLQYASQNGLVLLTANASDFVALHSEWIKAKLPHSESSLSTGRTTPRKTLLFARYRRLLQKLKGPDSHC
jgi:predicted nuclease of predicted toxin-antitoxin system